MAKVKDIKKKKRDSWDRRHWKKKKVKASLKIVSFPTYEIQCNFQFPMNHMLFSSPIQSSEVSIIYSKLFTEWVEGRFYHDLAELYMKKVHPGLPKQI